MLKRTRGRIGLAAAPALLLLLLGLIASGAAGGGAVGFVNPQAPTTMAEQAQGGAEGPFYPSAVSTHGGGLLPAAAFTSSQSCGRSGCHPDIVQEWSASTHRYSGLDNPWYRSAYEDMVAERGPVPARWCQGCHAPGQLTSGLADRPAAEVASSPVGHAGISCTVCHGISQVESSTGQGDYELDPTPGLGAAPGNALSRFVESWRIRRNPRAHREAWARPALKTQELCATCHKAWTAPPVSDHSYFEVMNDYDPWQANSVSGQAMTQSIYFPEPQSCVDCHMPRVPSRDPAAQQGRIHSHRFAAANTALPAWRGDGEQLRAVSENLRARRVTLDFFAMSKGRPLDVKSDSSNDRITGLYAPLDRVPATLRRGESTRFDIVLRSRGVGHMFPGGKNVFRDCWIEVKAVDDRGRTLFWSGRMDEDGRIDPTAHFMSGLWIDKEGRTIEAQEIWRSQVGIYQQRIEPETGFVARFRVNVPPDAGDRITLTARLHYRTFGVDFTRRAFDRAGLPPPSLPVVTVAESSVELPVVAAGAELPDMTRPASRPEIDFERWNDYAFGLANRGDYLLSRKAFQKVLELRPDYADAWTTLGNLEWAVGDMNEARSKLNRALEIDPRQLRAHYYLGMVEQREGNYAPALEHLRAAAAAYPRERLIWKEIGRTLFMNGDYTEAVDAFDRALAVNPQDFTAHFMLAMAYRALGKPDLSQHYQKLYESYKDDPFQQQLAVGFFSRFPQANIERQALHEHFSMPLDGSGIKAGQEGGH